MKCVVDGCTSPVRVQARGLCKYHYGRWWRGKPLEKPIRNYIRDFLAKLDKSDPSGCWPYTGGKDPDGYGIYTVHRKSVRAHRYAYQIMVGQVTRGLMVCHSCDNPPCCNPKHLFLGSGKDNSLDMMSKGRWAGSPTSKLTVDDMRAIREAPRTRGSGKVLRARYGVSIATITRVRRMSDDQLLALTNRKLAQLVPETA